MLQLKRVELQGFKSFCDKSEMRFHGKGIAAIVGPNGCGKSNLSDAISWVLGEQSAKSLRGAKMEDVIFAGTRTRKALGLASVTLTLADPEAHTDLPSRFSKEKTKAKPANGVATNAPLIALGVHAPQEITITRRLYRSGESEYLVNGKTARLRDIQDLFMGTGLGPESYAIIEQGRIGQILSNKPGDRRAVIEEAAGITRFKTKRRLAESKLDGAKQNLTRVFDILEEVSRQVNTLKRQAAKAKRYEELRGELVTHLRTALAGRFRTLERDAAKVALDFSQATNQHQQSTAELDQYEKTYQVVQQRNQANETQLHETRKRLNECSIERERTRGKLESQTHQLASLDMRAAQNASEAAQLAVRSEALEAELDTQRQALTESDQQTAQARQRLSATEAERTRTQTALRDQERAVETGRQQLLKWMGEISSLRNQLAQIDEFLSGVDRDAARSQREEQAAAADHARLETTKADLSGREAARQQELLTTSTSRKEIEQELQQGRQRATELRRKLDELRGELSKAKARRDSLFDVLAHRSYTTGAVKKLFTAVEKNQVRDVRPVGVLADFLDVDPAYEKPVEEFLHEELEFVLVQSGAEAQRGIDLMRSELDGRATFVSLERCEPLSTALSLPDLRQEPGVAAKLSDVLRASSTLTVPLDRLLPKIARCYLAADRVTAQRLAPLHPELYFLAPDGVCYSGAAVSGGKKTGNGPLALKRELKEMEAAAAALQKDHDAAAQTLKEAEARIPLLTEELERLRNRQQQQEKDAATLAVELRKLAEEAQRVQSRLSIARMELQRLEQQREKSKAQRDANLLQIEIKEKARTEQEVAVEQARIQVAAQQAAVLKAGEEHATLRAELAASEERQRSLRSAHGRLQAQLQEVQQRRAHLAQERDQLAEGAEQLQASNRQAQDRLEVLEDTVASLSTAAERLGQEDSGLREQLSSGEEALRRLRVATQAGFERKSQLEVTLVGLRAELKFLEETCRKDLGVGLEEIADPQAVVDPEALASAEQKAQEARQKIENLGPVNSQALEEFEVAQQRHTFLDTQRHDLLDSIRDTERAIKEIDVESKHRFQEAFTAINHNFRETFKVLFGGGIGEMRLAEGEDAYESGIDIFASPPGKTLQSVLLLSGGEKALTAMALLMGIFKYQPSPFCILDEVDAPLDEPNTERLNRLIREMAVNTQFVVITHSKRTMEAAQVLYGVTMQEPGISKLVSVKFEPVAAANGHATVVAPVLSGEPQTALM